MHEAIQSANEKIFVLGELSQKCANMGTTITAVLCLPERWVVGQVGDSRAYHLSVEGIRQVTRDHSMVEQMVEEGTMQRNSAEYLMQRHILTRAVGVRMDEKGEVFSVAAQEGDALLCCSDGLSELLSMQEIEKIYRTAEGIQNACQEMIELALERGGVDNITVCICQMEEGQVNE